MTPSGEKCHDIYGALLLYFMCLRLKIDFQYFSKTSELDTNYWLPTMYVRLLCWYYSKNWFFPKFVTVMTFFINFVNSCVLFVIVLSRPSQFAYTYTTTHYDCMIVVRFVGWKTENRLADGGKQMIRRRLSLQFYTKQKHCWLFFGSQIFTSALFYSSSLSLSSLHPLLLLFLLSCTSVTIFLQVFFLMFICVFVVTKLCVFTVFIWIFLQIWNLSSFRFDVKWWSVLRKFYWDITITHALAVCMSELHFFFVWISLYIVCLDA